MTIRLDRSVCCDINETIAREWLVTNGLGGYAAGTVAGVLTRLQHGLLVAMPPHTTKPQLLLAKIDEEVSFDQRTFYLGTNEYRDGTLNPCGFVHLEAFRLEDGFPVFTYRLGGLDGISLEKRVWMAHGENTTYIQYRVWRQISSKNRSTRQGLATGPLRPAQALQESVELTLLPLTTYRPYDAPLYGHNDTHFSLDVHSPGHYPDTTLQTSRITACTIQANSQALPYYMAIVSQGQTGATIIPTGVWYWNFLRRQDTASGQPRTDDLYLPGVIRATLDPDAEQTLTMMVSTEELSSRHYQVEQISYSYQKSVAYQRSLTAKALDPQRFFGDNGEAAHAHHLDILPMRDTTRTENTGQTYLQLLLQAADHFLVHNRAIDALPVTAQQPYRHFAQPISTTTRIITNPYQQECRVRDTLIGLPGLLMVAERYTETATLLRGLSRYFIGGLLPDRLPTPQAPLEDNDYRSADIPLWYFYALDHYLRKTGDHSLLEEVMPHLKECIHRYTQGTHQGIYLDKDGLLMAHKTGRALTWMNAYVQDVPVTQRAGKPVEINALWYHALSLLHAWSEQMHYAGQYGYNAQYYANLADHCYDSFQTRFWNAERGFLYDVVDGPNGDDATLRVNQLFSLSLHYPILAEHRRQQVLQAITQHLLTPVGLRTLAPGEPDYRGSINTQHGDAYAQALHQGCVWPWLLGHYIHALLSIPDMAQPRQNTLVYQEYTWHKALQLLEGFLPVFNKDMLGSVSDVYAGDSPHQSAQTGPSALSIAELLRVYDTLTHVRANQHQEVFSH